MFSRQIDLLSSNLLQLVQDLSRVSSLIECEKKQSLEMRYNGTTNIPNTLSSPEAYFLSKGLKSCSRDFSILSSSGMNEVE